MQLVEGKYVKELFDPTREMDCKTCGMIKSLSHFSATQSKRGYKVMCVTCCDHSKWLSPKIQQELVDQENKAKEFGGSLDVDKTLTKQVDGLREWIRYRRRIGMIPWVDRGFYLSYTMGISKHTEEKMLPVSYELFELLVPLYAMR